MYADVRLVDGMGHVVHAGLECMPHVEYRLIYLAGALGEMVLIHRMAVPVALLTSLAHRPARLPGSFPASLRSY